MVEPLIPYITIPELPIIPHSGSFEGVTIKPFGTLVAIGVYAGWVVAARQARRLRLDTEVMNSFIGWVLAGGFIGGHVFDVLLYHSSQLDQPLFEAFKNLVFIWRSQSSFGGFMGALIGVLVWKHRFKVKSVLSYVDTMGSGFPVGWVFGRTGCSVAHDHPGMISNVWFAVRDYHGPGNPARIDLGLVEMVLTIPLALWFLYMMRKPRPYGFYTGAMCVAYAPVRFLLDFMRARDVSDADPRHLGLTPAQWLCVGLLLLGVYFLRVAWRAARRGETPVYVDDARGAGGGAGRHDEVDDEAGRGDEAGERDEGDDEADDEGQGHAHAADGQHDHDEDHGGAKAT